MSPDALDLALLPALGLLCAVTSWEDARTGLIRNKWVLAGLLWGLAAYAALSLTRAWWPGLTDPALENTLFAGSWGRLLWMTALNAAAALVCGFLIFHLDYWSAGDAKLFFVIALLLPLKYYFRHFLPGFPAFSLFLNVMTVAALYIWGEACLVIGRYIRANPQMNVWREIVDSSAVKFRGALRVLLVAAVAFTALMFAGQLLRLGKGVSTSVSLLAMTALLLGGGSVEQALERRGARLAFYAFSALFFAAALASPLRWQALAMTFKMCCVFTALFFLTSVLPGLSAKYGGQREEMPFAIFLALGAALTAAMKGALVYLLVV